jgi:hypothetical protein
VARAVAESNEQPCWKATAERVRALAAQYLEEELVRRLNQTSYKFACVWHAIKLSAGLGCLRPPTTNRVDFAGDLVVAAYNFVRLVRLTSVQSGREAHTCSHAVVTGTSQSVAWHRVTRSPISWSNLPPGQRLARALTQVWIRFQLSESSLPFGRGRQHAGNTPSTGPGTSGIQHLVAQSERSPLHPVDGSVLQPIQGRLVHDGIAGLPHGVVRCARHF